DHRARVRREGPQLPATQLTRQVHASDLWTAAVVAGLGSELIGDEPQVAAAFILTRRIMTSRVTDECGSASAELAGKGIGRREHAVSIEVPGELHEDGAVLRR